MPYNHTRTHLCRWNRNWPTQGTPRPSRHSDRTERCAHVQIKSFPYAKKMYTGNPAVALVTADLKPPNQMRTKYAARHVQSLALTDADTREQVQKEMATVTCRAGICNTRASLHTSQPADETTQGFRSTSSTVGGGAFSSAGAVHRRTAARAAKLEGGALAAERTPSPDPTLH